MSESMKQAFGLIRRPWGVFYLKNKITGQQTSLKTSDKAEAQPSRRTTNRRASRISTCHWRACISTALIPNWPRGHGKT